MPILVLSTWFPFPADNGSRLRAWNLLKQLAKRDEIHLIAGVQDDSPRAIPAEVSELCSRVDSVAWKWYAPGPGGLGETLQTLMSPVPRSIRETPNPELRRAIESGLAQNPRVVLAMELGMDAYLPDRLPVPTVIDQVEFSGMERAWRAASGREKAQRYLTWAKGVGYWRSRMGKYAAVTAVSDAEADAVRKVVPESVPVVVLPNGVDVGAYPPRVGNGVSGRMLYNGALSYGPNRDAVEWFVAEILPEIAHFVPDAHLVVTGRADSAPRSLTTNPRVVLTGFLPDLNAALAESSVCVVPLRSGGGTRLKILEAWAARLPVVSTTIGAAGLDAVSGETLLLADSPDSFARETVRLLTDSALAQSLAESAHTVARGRFDWRTIGESCASLLDRHGRQDSFRAA